MRTPFLRPLTAIVSALTCTLMLSCNNGSSLSSGSSDAGTRTGAAQVPLGQEASAYTLSDYLKVGEGLDAPGRLEFDLPPAGSASGPCSKNTQFKFGSGLHDITGPVANTGGAGWEDPTQVLSGLHMRQYARAFAFESPCDQKHFMFVSADVGLLFGSIRQGVINAIAKDSELSKIYGPENIMLSATHTHQGPAGYGHHDGFNAFHFGFDALVLQTIVDGIVQSIRKAHASLLTHEGTASIPMAVGELLNANINRSKPAFAMNSESERRQFLNQKGQEIQVDKRVVQLGLARNDGTVNGIINWFGVHPTTIGQKNHLVSSDNKGFASLVMERLMKTRYDTPIGGNTFVAAFAQKDEGDASPNIFIEQFPTPDPRRGGGKDDFENNAIAGTKQLAKAISLLNTGTVLTGPMDYRFMHVKMDTVSVKDPVILAQLKHPAALDAPDKRTCSAALGVSFGGGAEDGPGPTVEGISCKSPPDVIAAAQKDFAAAQKGKLPPALLSAAVLCNVSKQPLIDLSCQAEKPVLFPVGGPTDLEPSVLPFQMFRLGNLLVVGLPWEVTTMSARRIRQVLFAELGPVGIDTIVIAGLVNDYVHYLTTREEYASQQYEGGSTIFGPWSLAVVQQETRRMALSLRNQTALDKGPAYKDVQPRLVRPPYIPSDLPGGPSTPFGALVADAPKTATTGQTIQAEFQSAHPRNDLRLQQSYVYAEMRQSDGQWQPVAQDRDPELAFVWKPQKPSPLPLDIGPTGPSTALAVWTIPCSTAPGVYRLRHVGTAQSAPNAPKQTFEGVSGNVVISRSSQCKGP